MTLNLPPTPMSPLPDQVTHTSSPLYDDSLLVFSPQPALDLLPTPASSPLNLLPLPSLLADQAVHVPDNSVPAHPHPSALVDLPFISHLPSSVPLTPLPHTFPTPVPPKDFINVMFPSSAKPSPKSPKPLISAMHAPSAAASLSPPACDTRNNKYASSCNDESCIMYDPGGISSGNIDCSNNALHVPFPFDNNTADSCHSDECRCNANNANSSSINNSIVHHSNDINPDNDAANSHHSYNCRCNTRLDTTGSSNDSIMYDPGSNLFDKDFNSNPRNAAICKDDTSSFNSGNHKFVHNPGSNESVSSIKASSAHNNGKSPSSETNNESDNHNLVYNPSSLNSNSNHGHVKNNPNTRNRVYRWSKLDNRILEPHYATFKLHPYHSRSPSHITVTHIMNGKDLASLEDDDTLWAGRANDNNNVLTWEGQNLNPQGGVRATGHAASELETAEHQVECM